MLFKLKTTIHWTRTKTTRCALTRRWHPFFLFRPSTMFGGAKSTILRPRPTLPMPQNHGCCCCCCCSCLPACALESGNRRMTVVNPRQRSPSDHCKALNWCAKFRCEISALADRRPTTDLRAGPGRETNARRRPRVVWRTRFFGHGRFYRRVFDGTVTQRDNVGTCPL